MTPRNPLRPTSIVYLVATTRYGVVYHAAYTMYGTFGSRRAVCGVIASVRAFKLFSDDMPYACKKCVARMRSGE